MLSIVPLLREDGAMFAGREPYSILRLAENPAMWDALSYGGRPAAYAWGTPLLISLKAGLLPQLLPPLLGFFSFLLFWKLLKMFKIDKTTRQAALAILIISPPFIYLFTTLNSHFIAVFLALSGVYGFVANRRIVASLAFIIMPLFNLPLAAISIILLFILAFFSKKQEQFWVIFVCTTITATAYYLTLANFAGSPEKLLFAIRELGFSSQAQHYFSDLGGRFGLSIFGAMLALLGVLYSWKSKYSNLSVFFILAALLAMMPFTTHAIFIMNFLIAILAANALTTIINRGWESKTLKNFTLLIITCGLIFSSFTFIERHADSEPSKGIIDAIEFLEGQEDGVVFSHYSRGYWLEFAGKGTVTDENFAFAPDVNERWQDSKKLLETRAIDEATEIIDKYDIKYIWLDKQLRKELWEHKEEGLQFLLEYSAKFKKIYISDEVQIYGVNIQETR